MKRQIPLIIVIILLLVILMWQKPPEVQVVTEKVYIPVVEKTPVPEYRPPPYKTYKPPTYQQMGLLLGEDGSTLPLWGRQTWGYKDRYNYYSTTPGDQLYPLPITHQNRDCTEDIGCQELYGGEQVDVFSKNVPYTTKIYRTIHNLV